MKKKGYLAFLLGTKLVPDSVSTGLSSGSIPMYYKAALTCDNPLGLYELGTLYFRGLGDSEKGQDIEKACELLKRSYDLKKTQYSTLLLGLAQCANSRTKEEEICGFNYLSESLEMGEYGGLEALAQCYEYGIGVKKNVEKAKEYREKAAKHPIVAPDPVKLINAFMS